MSGTHRSTEVRKQARAELLRLRQERMGRRTGRLGHAIENPVADEVFEGADQTVSPVDTPAADIPPVEPATCSHLPDDGDSASAAVSGETDAGVVEDDPSPDDSSLPSDLAPSDEGISGIDKDVMAETDEIEEPSESKATAEDGVTDINSDGAAHTKASEDSQLSPDDDACAAPIDAAADPHPCEDGAATPPDDSDDAVIYDTDLTNLPGAGPGLVWMLQKASVRSLADLAQADTDVLRSALGPVGEILDVDQLIDMARNGVDRTE